MCGDSELKKPRLFYYEEGLGAFIPVSDNEIPGIIDLDHFSADGEVIELQLKRIDMTDSVFDNMPEA